MKCKLRWSLVILTNNMIMREKSFILNITNYGGANSVITAATLYSHITGAHVKFHSVSEESVEIPHPPLRLTR